MGKSAAALAACGGGHGVDRRVVLFHAPRCQPETSEGHSGRQGRRQLAGTRRRLLRNAKVPGLARVLAGGADLAQMAGLYDLALRLHAAGLYLLRSVAPLSDQSRRDAAERAASLGARHRCARAWLGGLRPTL